jgi:hypothetical protein
MLSKPLLPQLVLTFSPQTHLTFGKEFTEAVEAKQVAQQEAERARFVVEKVSVQPDGRNSLSLLVLGSPICRVA